MFRKYIAFAVLFCSVATLAQTTDDAFQVKLQQARTLFELGRGTEALPLFKDLVRIKPDSIPALEGYAMTLLMSDAASTDPEEKKRMRVEARKAFLKARELGDTSNISALGEDIPEDGSFAALSDRNDVAAALQAGETDYAKGDYESAIDNYGKALALDPQNYLAALYIGDVLFKQAKYDAAGGWFAKAIAIDPNRETAYRYWGDALKSQGKWDEAKTKFIDGIVAEPYERKPWMGLAQWADARGMKLVKPNIQPQSTTDDKDDKNVNITINIGALSGDKNDISGAAWLMYSMTHVIWKNQGEFLKRYPNEKQYRHSLAEEMEAFSGVVDVVKDNTTKKKKPKLDAQLQELMELDSKGLLAPFILIHRADNGIAQDYAPYREQHRDKLREYIEICVVQK